MEKTLTLAEFCEQTGIPPGTVRFWRHKGEGPDFRRVGRRLRITESRAQEWIDKHMQGENPAA